MAVPLFSVARFPKIWKLYNFTKILALAKLQLGFLWETTTSLLRVAFSSILNIVYNTRVEKSFAREHIS